MDNIIFTTILENKEKPLNSWKQIFDQEKLNYRLTKGKHTKLIITNNFQRNKKQILEFVDDGGTCVIQQPNSIEELKLYKDEEISISQINFPEFGISNAKYPTTAFSYKKKQEHENTIGYFRIFEERVTKENIFNSNKPIFIKRKYGQGTIYICTLDFQNFLNVNGNTLRPIKSRFSSTEVTERISQIDKDLILFSLVELIKMIHKDLNLPWVSFSKFPEGVDNVFLMRMDVDGSDSRTMKNISDVGAKHRIPITFYLNKTLIDNTSLTTEDIEKLDSIHDIANHAVVHNTFDTYEENLKNVQQCDEWIHDTFDIKPDGFVAPRGIWNNSLERALVNLGYDYSSDFGFTIHGLPFRPYINNQESKIIQLPVNPYNVGRAETFYEGKKDYLSDDSILDYYYSYFNDVLSDKGSGLIHIFGHPHGLGKRVEVLESLFKYINYNDITAMSIREFIDWWKYREESEYELKYENNQYHITFNKNPIHYKIEEGGEI